MNRIFIISLVITGFMAGLLLTWQFSMDLPLSSDYPADEVQARDDLFKDFLDEQSYLQSRIVTLRQQIEDSQNDIDVQTETVNLELLNNLKEQIGLTEVSGAGIEINLDDSPLATRDGSNVTDALLIQASDLRDVVNLLNAASAQAVSINNQRIIATSPISSVGTTILVNNSYIAPPFIITAVGDTDSMLQRLTNTDLLPDIYLKLQSSGIVFEVAKKNNISIPMYNGDLKTSYINLVE